MHYVNVPLSPLQEPKAAKPDSPVRGQIVFLVWRGETQRGVTCLRFIREPGGQVGDLKPGSRTFTGFWFLPLTLSAVLVLLCAPKVVRSCTKEPQCAFPSVLSQYCLVTVGLPTTVANRAVLSPLSLKAL